MRLIRTSVITCLFAGMALAQNSALVPWPKVELRDASGRPAAGACLYSYTAGTSTPQATYSDSGLTVLNTNPVVLDSAGRADVWVTASSYKFVLGLPSSGVCPGTPSDVVWTKDRVFDVGQVLKRDLADVSNGKGAALVAIPGNTRNAADKLTDFLNVLDKAADATGAADSSDAFTAALASGTTVQVCTGPSGQAYKLTSTITIPVGVTLQLGGCTINSTATGGAFFLAGSGSAIVASPGASPVIRYAPTVANQDIVVIGTAGENITRTRVVGVTLQAVNANVRHGIHVVSGVFSPSFEDNNIYGPGELCGGCAFATGHGIALTDLTATGGDFIHIRHNQIHYWDEGILQNSQNFTSSDITQNQIASMAGPCIDFPGGGGQSSVTLNTIYNCNYVRGGGAIRAWPSEPNPPLHWFADMTIADNSFQRNGQLEADSADMMIGEDYGGYVSNIILRNNQCNDAAGLVQGGAHNCIKLKYTTRVVLDHNSCERTGQTDGGCFDVDSTNTYTTYLKGQVTGASPEFVSRAGISTEVSGSGIVTDSFSTAAFDATAITTRALDIGSDTASHTYASIDTAANRQQCWLLKVAGAAKGTICWNDGSMGNYLELNSPTTISLRYGGTWRLETDSRGVKAIAADDPGYVVTTDGGQTLTNKNIILPTTCSFPSQLRNNAGTVVVCP